MKEKRQKDDKTQNMKKGEKNPHTFMSNNRHKNLNKKQMEKVNISSNTESNICLLKVSYLMGYAPLQSFLHASQLKKHVLKLICLIASTNCT